MAKAKKSKKRRRRDPLDYEAILRKIGPPPAFQSVFSVEQAADVARRRVKWQKDLADEIARHRRRQRMDDTEELQERNNPTVPIAVEDPEGTRKARRNLTRVRQAEAWRHNRLTGMQRDAEREMEFAWRHRTLGLGAAVSKYGDPGGKALSLDWTALGATMEAAWVRWAKQTRSRRIRRNAAIDVLAEPKTLGQVERDHGLGRGEAFNNYVAALDLWCELRGWIQPRRPPAKAAAVAAQ